MSSTAIYLYQTGLGLEAYFVPRRKHAQPNLGLLYPYHSQFPDPSWRKKLLDDITEKCRQALCND